MEKIIEALSSNKINGEELRFACEHFVMGGSPFKKADKSVEELNGFIGVQHDIYGSPVSIIAIRENNKWYTIFTSRSNISEFEISDKMFGYYIGNAWKIKSLGIFKRAKVWSLIKDRKFSIDD